MSEHTRGPWEANGDTVYAKDSGMRVCDIRGWGYLTGKGVGALGLPDDQAFGIQLANARLIAAAPELLSVLAPFVAFYEHALRGHTPDYEHRSDPDKVVCGWNGAHLTMRDFKNARAALAKAENG